jgi:hypothetical protein
VSPLHLRELRQNDETPPQPPAGASLNERRRRIRDAVEAALSDIILLGTEEQVELAPGPPRIWWPVDLSRPPRWSPAARLYPRRSGSEPIPSHLQIPSQARQGRVPGAPEGIARPVKLRVRAVAVAQALRVQAWERRPGTGRRTGLRSECWYGQRGSHGPSLMTPPRPSLRPFLLRECPAAA